MSSNMGIVGRSSAAAAIVTGLTTGVLFPFASAGQPAAGQQAMVNEQGNSSPVRAAVPLSFDRASVSSSRQNVAQEAQTAAASHTVVPVDPDGKQPAELPKKEKLAEANTNNIADSGTARPDAGWRADLVREAYKQLGRPYKAGGTTPSGWDCSGFVAWVYAQVGINVPRTRQWAGMSATSLPQPGDLVVQNGGSHVAIYVGDGMEIGALNPAQGTQLTRVRAVGSSAYYTLDR